jgi:hypothetical protein
MRRVVAFIVGALAALYAAWFAGRIHQARQARTWPEYPY